jgi:catechol 2,3-dioxygenase-like lactoylglutathione lyase family enzyme
MDSTQTAGQIPAGTGKSYGHDMKLEVVVIPVSDIERAKCFYAGLGWRLDADFARGEAFRIVQFTPPGSSCSVQFGKGRTTAAPGSAQGLFLVVSDIEATRISLVASGVEASEVFHQDGQERVKGADPAHHSYSSFVSFRDPDGNSWLVQEVTARLPGRVDGDSMAFGSASDLAAALRRAEKAHGEHEKRIGERDECWPDWYAAYMIAEQSGKPLPI